MDFTAVISLYLLIGLSDISIYNDRLGAHLVRCVAPFFSSALMGDKSFLCCLPTYKLVVGKNCSHVFLDGNL